jgi:hypothetical protein
MRFLRHAYLDIAVPGDVPAADKFYNEVFRQIELEDSDFNIDNFPPGSAGEAKLVRLFRRQEKLPR